MRGEHRLLGGALALSAAFWAMNAAAQAPAPAPAGPPAFEGPAYVILFVDAKAESAAKAAALLKRYGAAARKDSANHGVRIIQEIGRPNRLAVIETWTDQPAAEARDKTPLFADMLRQLEPLEIAPPDRRMHHTFLVGGEKPAGKGAVFAVTHIDVNPPNRVATDGILKQLVADSRQDAGNLAFDVYWQNLANLNHYDSVAVWRDRKSFDAYERAAHTRTARNALQPLLGALYDERLYRIVD